MNKWQIICPVAAMVIVLVAILTLNGLPGSRDYRYFITVRTGDIGRELIAATNSPRLAEIDPN